MGVILYVADSVNFKDDVWRFKYIFIFILFWPFASQRKVSICIVAALHKGKSVNSVKHNYIAKFSVTKSQFTHCKKKIQRWWLGTGELSLNVCLRQTDVQEMKKEKKTVSTHFDDLKDLCC